MTQNNSSTNLLALTADIVSAHVGRNDVPATEIPALIRQVHRALADLGDMPAGTPEAATASRTPAVPVKKSVTPDYIVCLEDGRKLKMLKRYLRGAFNLTPEDYRAKWNLPADYPMVAPNYAEQRRSLAKKIGLGTSRSRKR